MLLDDGADVVVGIKAYHDGVVRSNTDPDDGEHGRADVAGSRHRASLLEHHRVENSVATLDGERQDQTGGVVGEQVANVLLENAEELDPVDQVERNVREIPAADGRQQTSKENAEEVQRVGHGEGEQIDVG